MCRASTPLVTAGEPLGVTRVAREPRGKSWYKVKDKPF